MTIDILTSMENNTRGIYGAAVVLLAVLVASVGGVAAYYVTKTPAQTKHDTSINDEYSENTETSVKNDYVEYVAGSDFRFVVMIPEDIEAVEYVDSSNQIVYFQRGDSIVAEVRLFNEGQYGSIDEWNYLGVKNNSSYEMQVEGHRAFVYQVPAYGEGGEEFEARTVVVTQRGDRVYQFAFIGSIELSDFARDFLSNLVIRYGDNSATPASDVVSQIKNASYRFPGSDETVQFKNGISYIEFGYGKGDAGERVPGYPNPEFSYAIDLVASGDLTHDGINDAAFVVASKSGGQGTYRVLHIGVGSGNSFSIINTIDLGDRSDVRGLEIRDGRVVVTYTPWNAADDSALIRHFEYVDGFMVERSLLSEGDIDALPKNVSVSPAVVTQDFMRDGGGVIRITGDNLIDARGDQKVVVRDAAGNVSVMPSSVETNADGSRSIVFNSLQGMCPGVHVSAVPIDCNKMGKLLVGGLYGVHIEKSHAITTGIGKQRSEEVVLKIIE
jgi:hypothetical protein